MPSVVERFWSKVVKSDGCWEFTGTPKYRRPALNVDRVPVLTHRLSWQLHFGDIPKGMCVCHRCDNPRCVRPDHLFLGTQADNMADKTRKGRQTKGVAVHTAHLTEHKVRLIRELSETIPTHLIAQELGLNYQTTYDVVKLKTWKHVT